MLEGQLAELLTGTSDAAFAADLQGEIRTWNKAAEELFGYPASYAVGKSCAEIVGGGIPTGIPVCHEFCDILECVRTGREVSNFDMQVQTSSGKSVWVNVSLLVTFNEHTERRFFVHFMRDISDRKHAEQLTNKMLALAKDLISGTDESRALPPVSPLTAQEKKILHLMASGRNSAEVIAELQISMRTLRNHLSNVNQKLHTTNRTQAIVQALKRGMI